ncbi:MAG: Yip1 domain protein [Anaerosolibacter sp.]|uniref:Yip1 family protein n=1 Tax=Anaerosolibacter sp. TaxID=1872527 RepID=UPI00261A2D97|nr:Yip1 family protein [Anaerosolibacter sp.]MDF2546619.1 Yip1 domain protein [Anaerosolibacter sp.]
MSEFENNTDVLMQEEKQIIELSWWERVKYLVIEPDKTMEYLSEKPKVLFPILVIIFGFALLILPKLDMLRTFTQDAMMTQYAAQGIDMDQLPANIIEIGYWTGIVTAVLIPFITMFMKSTIVHIISRISGGKGKFKAVLSVVGYGYLINLFGEGIRTIISVITNSYIVYTSSAAFLPDAAQGTALHTLFSTLDVFSIWYLVLATIGLAYVHQMSRKKAGFIVFGSWLVMVMFSVGMTFMKIKG